MPAFTEETSALALLCDPLEWVSIGVAPNATTLARSLEGGCLVQLNLVELVVFERQFNNTVGTASAGCFHLCDS
jgi:hypothetical protein